MSWSSVTENVGPRYSRGLAGFCFLPAISLPSRAAREGAVGRLTGLCLAGVPQEWGGVVKRKGEG